VKAEEDADPLLVQVFGSSFANLTRDLIETGNPDAKAAALAAMLAA
jgi:hypothetical protein